MFKLSVCPSSCSFSSLSLIFVHMNFINRLLQTKRASSHSQNKEDVHFLVRWQTEGATVGQLHDVDGEPLVFGLITEAKLHLRAAQRQPLLVGAQEEVCREARPGGDTNTQAHKLFIELSM